MKGVLILIAGIAAGVAIMYFSRDPQTPDPNSDLAANQSGSGGGAPQFGDTGAPVAKTFPRMRNAPTPEAKQTQAKSAFSEFVDEIGLSEKESEEFFEVLKEAEQGLLDLAKVDDVTGIPIIPTQEQIKAHRAIREKRLNEILGSEGYEKFKGYSTTLSFRFVMSNLERSGTWTPLGAEQRSEVLNRAYEEISKEALPPTPQEYAKKLGEAVLKYSSEHLSPDDQNRLAEAIEADQVRAFRGFGGPPK